MFKDCARIFQCIECLRCGSLAHWVASLESQFSCLRRLIIHSVIPLLLYVPCICVSLLFDCCCILTAWEEKVPDMHFAGVCFHSYLLFVFELWQMFQFAGSYFIWVCLFLELKPSGTIWLGFVLDKLPLVAKFVPDLFLSNVKRRRRLEQHKNVKAWSGFRNRKYQSGQVAKEKDLLLYNMSNTSQATTPQFHLTNNPLPPI